MRLDVPDILHIVCFHREAEGAQLALHARSITTATQMGCRLRCTRELDTNGNVLQTHHEGRALQSGDTWQLSRGGGCSRERQAAQPQPSSSRAHTGAVVCIFGRQIAAFRLLSEEAVICGVCVGALLGSDWMLPSKRRHSEAAELEVCSEQLSLPFQSCLLLNPTHSPHPPHHRCLRFTNAISSCCDYSAPPPRARMPRWCTPGTGQSRTGC